MCVFIFLVKSGWLSGHLLGKWLPIWLTICFVNLVLGGGGGYGPQGHGWQDL